MSSYRMMAASAVTNVGMFEAEMSSDAWQVRLLLIWLTSLVIGFTLFSWLTTGGGDGGKGNLAKSVRNKK